MRHGASGEGGTGSAACEEWQAATALNRERALTGNLMERVSERENLSRAYKRVKGNKGVPGTDGMTVGELYDWLREHKSLRGFPRSWVRPHALTEPARSVSSGS